MVLPDMSGRSDVIGKDCDLIKRLRSQKNPRTRGLICHIALLVWFSLPGELGQFNLWPGIGQGSQSRDHHACAIEAGE